MSAIFFGFKIRLGLLAAAFTVWLSLVLLQLFRTRTERQAIQRAWAPGAGLCKPVKPAVPSVEYDCEGVAITPPGYKPGRAPWRDVARALWNNMLLLGPLLFWRWRFL